jgi:hypothetical protein
MAPATRKIVKIVRKLEAMAALVGVLVSLAAICPCVPTAPTRPGQAAGDEHACCSGGASPTLIVARESCCDDHALAERSAPATSSAGVSLGADGAVALTRGSDWAISRSSALSFRFVSRPPSVLRI